MFIDDIHRSFFIINITETNQTKKLYRPTPFSYSGLILVQGTDTQKPIRDAALCEGAPLTRIGWMPVWLKFEPNQNAPFVFSKKFHPHCSILVGSRNVFERDLYMETRLFYCRNTVDKYKLYFLG